MTISKNAKSVSFIFQKLNYYWLNNFFTYLFNGILPVVGIIAWTVAWSIFIVRVEIGVFVIHCVVKLYK